MIWSVLIDTGDVLTMEADDKDDAMQAATFVTHCNALGAKRASRSASAYLRKSGRSIVSLPNGTALEEAEAISQSLRNAETHTVVSPISWEAQVLMSVILTGEQPFSPDVQA